jgi:hypothetical protein
MHQQAKKSARRQWTPGRRTAGSRAEFLPADPVVWSPAASNPQALPAQPPHHPQSPRSRLGGDRFSPAPPHRPAGPASPAAAPLILTRSPQAADGAFHLASPPSPGTPRGARHRAWQQRNEPAADTTRGSAVTMRGTPHGYNYDYDQVVPFGGERLSGRHLLQRVNARPSTSRPATSPRLNSPRANAAISSYTRSMPASEHAWVRRNQSAQGGQVPQQQDGAVKTVVQHMRMSKRGGQSQGGRNGSSARQPKTRYTNVRWRGTR